MPTPYNDGTANPLPYDATEQRSSEVPDLSGSQAALNAKQARNPVTPGTGTLGGPQSVPGMYARNIAQKAAGFFSTGPFAGAARSVFGDPQTQPEPGTPATNVHADALVPRKGESATQPESGVASAAGFGAGSADKQAGDAGRTAGAVTPPGAITGPRGDYSGTGPVSAATGMNTEQANQYYGAQNAVASARQAQAKNDADQRALATTQAAQQRWDAENSGGGASGRKIGSARQQRDAQASYLAQVAAANQASTAANAIGANRTPVQDALAQTQSAQGAQTHMLDLAKGQQGLQAGAQGLQKGAGDIQLQGQAIRQGEINAHIQQHMADLQKMALGTGPQADAAQASLAMYQKAQQGKGGPITDEDILKAHGDMATKAIQMGGPDALKSLPSFHEYKQALLGSGGGAPQDWLNRAKAANPGMTEAQIQAEYAKLGKK